MFKTAYNLCLLTKNISVIHQSVYRGLTLPNTKLWTGPKLKPVTNDKILHGIQAFSPFTPCFPKPILSGSFNPFPNDKF